MAFKQSKLKLSFGLKDNELFHISKVPRGLKCNCVCPACYHPLIARKGEIKNHHFAHYKKEECEKAVETALHLAAKKILETEKKIHLPEVIIKWGGLIYKECDIYFDKVRLEARIDNIVPDLIIYAKGQPLILEIAVSHFSDEKKLQKIRSMNISALEISLNKISRNIAYEELKDLIVHSTETKRWIYNVKGEKILNKIIDLSEKKKVIQRGFALHVDNCPINARVWRGNSYANLSQNCFNCDYIFDTISPMPDEEYDYTPIAIICLGKAKDHFFIRGFLNRS